MTKQKMLQVLKDARDVLSDETQWIQGQYRFMNSFCALGAICYVANKEGDEFNKLAALLDTTSIELYGNFVAALNDGYVTGKSKRNAYLGVLQVYDTTIDRLEKELKGDQ